MMEESKSTVIESVFFGIMAGDIYGPVDPEEEGIDVEASTENYAELCINAIRKGFTENGEDVREIRWDSQDVGGATPYNLKTKINGDENHPDVDFVDDILAAIWTEWEWVVEN